MVIGSWQRYKQNRAAVLGLLVLAFLAAVAFLGPTLWPRDPARTTLNMLRAPLSADYPMGTDHLGRDVLARFLSGARVSILVGVAASSGAVLIGTILGATSGYFGGAVDFLVMRTAEVAQVIPRFVVALVLVAVFGPSVAKIILVIAVLSWPQSARLVRGQFLVHRSAAYVDAARVLGQRSWEIIAKEILPNVVAPVTVVATLEVGQAILLEAALGFFGLSDPSVVSWGTMLNEAQSYLLRAWWTSVFPGSGIFLAVLGINLVGDGLNDAINPRLHRA